MGGAEAVGMQSKVRLKGSLCQARTGGHWLGKRTSLVNSTAKQNHEIRLVALWVAYQKDRITSAEYMWAQGNPCTALVGNVNIAAIMKTTWEYLKNEQ